MPVLKTSRLIRYTKIIVTNHIVKFFNFSILHLHMSYTLFVEGGM